MKIPVNSVQLAFVLACLMAALAAAGNSCDPLTELNKVATKDASLTFTMLTSMGLIAPGSLPQSGLTIFLPSDASLKLLSRQLPGGGKDTSPEAAAANWAKLPKETQDKLVSVLLYHVTASAYLANGMNVPVIPTALSLVHPGLNLELIDGGKQIKTGAGQKVPINKPVPVCGNYVYIVPQLMLPTQLQQIPETELKQALEVVQTLAASAV